MSGRYVVIVAGVVLVLLIGLVAASSLFFNSPSPHIAEQAAGTWHEIGEGSTYTMHVTHTGGTSYTVTYPRFNLTDEPFQLEGNGLVGGGGENQMNDKVKTITYNDGADELTISDRSGDHTYTLARVTP